MIRIAMIAIAIAATGAVLGTSAPPASAHQSGCHRWHSCPSDSGSYVCGDLGYYSGCPGYIPPPVYVPPVYTPPAVNVPPVYVPVAAQAGAASLPASIQQTCLPNGTVRVTFAWVPGYSGFQWLDLSLQNNGFLAGTAVGIGPLTSSTGGFVWDGLAPGRVHYARVNSLNFGRWEASATSTLLTVNCGFSSPAVLAGTSGVGETSATLQWAPANPTGSAQWIDLSLSNNGFAPGTFVSVGPLSPSQSSYFWAALRPGSTHYWRVNTRTAAGWASSSVGSLRTQGVVPPPTPSCHPSYTGACLNRYASDYDCAGGSGNGPYYTGRVIVVGPDVFDLDRDGDGVGCE